jgi:ubiquinone/menaquinone biosynthesis C-methylase UbiE
MREARYVPPLRYHALTRFYDATVRIATREQPFRRALVEQTAARDGARIIDLGCGTGTLAITLAKRYPAARVTGIDPDMQALAIARDKLRAAGIRVSLQRGRAEALPFADASFDRVVSSLLFQHLDLEQKLAALREARRVLKPHGEMHVADWGRPANAAMSIAFLAVQLLDGFRTTTESVSGRLPELFAHAGFAAVRETTSFDTLVGTLRLYRMMR